MNISTVIDNLKTKLADKEQLLAQYRQTEESDLLAASYGGRAPNSVLSTRIRYLEIETIELRCLIKDLEECTPAWSVHTCPYTDTCYRID